MNKQQRQQILTAILFATIICWFVSGILFSIERLERIEYYKASAELLDQTRTLNERQLESQKQQLEFSKKALEFYKKESVNR